MILNNKAKGILCILSAAFFFTLMNMFIRLAGDLPSIEKAFFRNFIAFFFAFVIILKDKISVKPQKETFIFLFLRAATGTLGVICNFYAVDHLALSDASMLNKMSPFFALVLSYFFLKEKITPVQAGAVIVAFIGCLLVIKPSFSNVDLIPSIIGFTGGLGAGAAYTCVRHLSKRGVRGPVIVFYFTIFSSLVTFPLMMLNFKMFTPIQFLFLMLTGFTAAAGQFSITAAYSFAPASELSVYDYSQVIFSAIIGYLVFTQLPDKLSFLGYIIIISMAVFMFFYKPKSKQEKET